MMLWQEMDHGTVDEEDTVVGDEAVAGGLGGNEAVAGDGAFAGDNALARYDHVAGDQVCVSRESPRLVPYSNSGAGQEREKGRRPWI